MLFIDLETFSRIDIRAAGAHRYSHECEVMLWSYAIDDGPVQCWDLTERPSMPRDLHEALEAVEHFEERIVAHNVEFERNVLAHQLALHIPADRWHDTAVLALTCGLPAKMDTVCKVLGFDEETAKLKDGARLIQRFCTPTPSNHKTRRYTRETHPAEWERFKEYCNRDVEVCRRLWHTLPHAVYDFERLNWVHDQRINERGLPVDLDLARTAVDALEQAKRRLDEVVSLTTHGQVDGVNALGALREWMAEQGYATESLDKAAVAGLLARPDLPANVRTVLEARRTAGKASTSKYEAALARAHGGRLYGATQFYGASRTGRQAGRGIQPQNMARPTLNTRQLRLAISAFKEGLIDLVFPDVFEAAASCARGVIAAPEGKKLVVSDLANIEGRMLAWLAGEEWKVQAFRDFDAGTGPDIYALAYARSFDVSPEEVMEDKKRGGNKRQIGKVQELALGYQGAVGAFHTMGAAYGVSLPDEAVLDIVGRWRAAHPQTTSFWGMLDAAAVMAVANPGKGFKAREIRFKVVEAGGYAWLCCRLPNGRALMYFDPKLDEQETRYGTRQVLTYVGQYNTGGFGRITTYGGKLAENVTQACSRDVLMAGVQAAEAHGYAVVLTVHDEVVTEVEDTPRWTVDELSSLLATPLSWCPDLPLQAAGYEDYFYRKD